MSQPVKSMVEVVREAIIAALRDTGNPAGAAFKLGISYSTLYRKIRDLEIRREEWYRSEDRAA